MSQTFSFELDMDKSRRSPQMVAARVGDMGSIKINASLVLNGAAYTPTGQNAYFECITNADTSVRVQAQKSGSTVTVDIPSQALCKPGVITCAYFRFENGTTEDPTFVESTQSFGIIVPTSIDDNIDAEDYLGEWRALEQQLHGYVDEVSAAATQAKKDISSDTSAVESAKSSAISAINADKQEVADAAAGAMKPINDALDQFEEDSQGAINAFNTKGTSAIGTFNTNGTNAISQFNTKGNNAVNAFNSQGTQKIQEFDDAADTKLDSVDSMISQAQSDVNADIAALEKATQAAIDAMEAALSEDQYGELLQRISRVWKLSSQDMTTINQGQDLNSFASVGCYACQSNAIAQSLQNKPDGLDVAFYMYVLQLSETPIYTQLVIPFTSSSNYTNVKVWVRSKEGASGWFGWHAIGAGSDILAGTGINVSGSGDSKEVSADPDAFHEEQAGVELASFDTSVTGGGSVQGMTIYGKTVQNLWVNPSGTNNGITATANANGSLTLSGMPNVAGSSPTISSGRIYTLKPNTTYIAFSDKAIANEYTNSSGACLYVSQYKSDESYITDKIFALAGNLSNIFVTDSALGYAICKLTVRPNTTVSGTYRVMLREATPEEIQQNTVLDDYWCPPGLSSIDEVEVVTAGKNLVGLGTPTAYPYTRNGITCTKNDDGSYTLDGKLSGASVCEIPIIGSAYNATAIKAQLGRYTVDSDSPDGVNFVVWFYDSITNDLMHAANVSETVTIDNPNRKLAAYLRIETTEKLDDVTVHLQLRFTSASSEYEAPVDAVAATVPLSTHSLRSLPDGTRDELQIDADGNCTLVKRVGASIAPTEQGSWFWETAGDGIASFTLPAKSTGTKTDMTGMMRCDKLPIRKVSGEASYAIVGTTQGHAKNPAITSVATASTIVGGATYLYKLATSQTISLGKISLPGVASSQVNVWVNGTADGTSFFMSPEIDVNLNKVDYKAQDVDLSSKEDAFDILSVSKGGTGVTSAAAERNRLGLGNTTAALPIANGGTGSTSAANARSALGITPANIGAATSNHTHTASQVSGLGEAAVKNITSQNSVRGRVAYINSDGVMEVGSYIDFHDNDGGSEDYDMRMSVGSNSTKFSKPVDIASGGTGATSASGAFSSLASQLSTLDSGGIASVIANASGGGYFKYTPKALAAALQQYISAGGDIDASDITSGVLAAARGGTGVTSAQAERNRLGLGNTTGALPVANGGTGATSASNAANTILGGVTGTTMTLGSTAEFFIDDGGVPSRLGYLTMVSDIGARLLGNSESNAQVKFLTVENVGGTLAGVASNVYDFINDCDNDGNEFLCLAKFTAKLAGQSFNVGLVGRLEKDLSNGGPTIYMSGIGWPTSVDSTSEDNAGLLLVHAFTNVTSSTMNFTNDSLYFLGIKSTNNTVWPPSSTYNIYGAKYSSSNFSFNRMLLFGYDGNMVS